MPSRSLPRGAPPRVTPRVLPALFLGVLLALVTSCGATSRRDLTSIPQRQITYDDMCHLQDHFDQRAAAHATPFRALEEQSTETSREERDETGTMRHVIVGEGTYLIVNRSDRLRLRQLLRDEYNRLPMMHLLVSDATVRLHVGWWQSGVVRRLRPDADVEIQIDNEHYELPTNPCVGEFLFGDEPYAMRRNVVGAERARAHGEIPTQYAHDDAGATAGPPDAAATPTPARD